ncbi:Gfo/Idh/MocA family oxidoreductase [Chelativorans sp. AA-79]|uniref:Gfo/Idh/MocA family protein n=1 Tax=Chelativorans sp. AA-79 TaxID=3028735 RepID=UPI0023F7944A|nr:Gfo/Idh/MocA family oxidoreductase [Chelativorans sp. AA-79]WEX12255.1 Gfo/Idh/MocA family oxidoreductase [Chelativorans sp. AA-79]
MTQPGRNEGIAARAPVEIGIIGAGWWACQAYIPRLLNHPDVSGVAVMRRDERALAKIAETFGTDLLFTDAAQMLEQRRLGGVIVASPHHLHAEHALMCIRKGLPVMIEKPMAVSSADARSIIDAADRQGVPVIVPYGWNFKPMTDTAYRLIREGWVGEIRHVSVHMASALKDLFAGKPPERTKDHLFRPPASTWSDHERAGGYGWGQLTHALGVLFRLVDLDPASVFARAGTSPTGVDYYDAAVVQMENGATMTLSGAATLPNPRRFQLDIRIFGEDGVLLYDIERARVEALRHDGRSRIEPLSPDAGEYETDGALGRFVDLCMGRNVENPASPVIGYRATRLIDAMYRSLASGRMEPA